MGDINHCPECEGELKTYISFIIPFNNSYCPDCDIIKLRVGSLPFLCKECHSIYFYEKGDEKTSYCWLCKSNDFISPSIDDFYKMEEAGELKQGFYAGRTCGIKCEESCLHEEFSNLFRHNEKVFKTYCQECNEDVYIRIPLVKQRELGWNLRDTIHIDEFINRDRTNEPKLMFFSNDNDLKEKVLKNLEERLKDT